MAVKIKLKRLGKIRTPQYRIVIADARTKREGRSIEEVGHYHPKEEPSFIQVDSDRVQHWLSVGAQPTEPVLAILKITGDWQKYKGLPGAEGTLRFAAPKPNKEDAWQAALAAAHLDPSSSGDATTTRRPRKAAPGAPAEAAPGAPAEAAVDGPVAGGTGQDAPVDTNPVESAEVEATAEDTTTGGDALPEAAVADDSLSSHESTARGTEN